MVRREDRKRVDGLPLPAMLLVIGMLLTGCSLIGDDGETTAGSDSGSTTEPTGQDAGTETTAATSNTTATSSNSDTSNSDTSNGDSSNGDSSNGDSSSGDTSTTGSSMTDSSAGSGSGEGPVFNDGFCDAPQRNQFDVRFEPGASSSVIDSAAIPGQVDLYRIGVGDDQIMTVTVGSNDSDAVFTLYQPDDSILPGAFTDTSVAPTQAGDYWICVTSGDNGDSYRLSVSVIDDNTPTKVDAPWCGSDVNDRGEIQFEPGRFTGQAEDAVIRGERDLYRFTAGEGQALDLFLVSPEFNAVFDLRAPSGEILMDEVSDFRIPLPESGTYEICVGATRGNTSYVLDVAIG